MWIIGALPNMAVIFAVLARWLGAPDNKDDQLRERMLPEVRCGGSPG